MSKRHSLHYSTLTYHLSLFQQRVRNLLVLRKQTRASYVMIVRYPISIFLPHGYLLPWGGNPLGVHRPFIEKKSHSRTWSSFSSCSNLNRIKIMSEWQQWKNRNMVICFFPATKVYKSRKVKKKYFLLVCYHSSTSWCFFFQFFGYSINKAK